MLDDPRDPELIQHTVRDMVRARVYGILAGYEDQNDQDTLRTDPVFKLLADRSPAADPLASQPTLSRFENSITVPSLKRLRDVLIGQFIASFDRPPHSLTFDVDAVDDPAHGEQQLTFWHGFYDQNQYLPLLITCADNDPCVRLSLRPGNVHAALGADDDLEYLLHRLRQVWPDVRVLVRGDASFGGPWMYAVGERLRSEYRFGLSSNPVLQARTAALLTETVAAYAQARQAAAAEEPRPVVPTVRRVTGFWYQAQRWPAPRWVLAKVEANAQGTTRRFVVCNRPGAPLFPEAAYEEYARRGACANRNKEFKCDLGMDRLSDHRFLANLFRWYLHAAAMNLLVRLRRFVAEPLPAPALPETPLQALAAQAAAELPGEALTGEARRRHFRQRRQRDPLGEGHPRTWRLLLIKVAAEVLVSCRRIVVRLSSSWPHQAWYRRVCERLQTPAEVVAYATG